MELPSPSALGPCMVVVPEAYAGLVQERWAVFVHEVEQLVRHLHGLSVANDDGGGGCGPRTTPHGLGCPGRRGGGGGGALGGGYPPTHPPPPPPPRPDPTRPKGNPGSFFFAPEAAYRPADGGRSFSFPPSPAAAPKVPQGPFSAPEPGPDADSLRSDSGRSRASSTVIGPPFRVLPTPPRPGDRAPTTATTTTAAADEDDDHDDDTCPSCRRTGGRRRRRRGPGLRRPSRRNRPRDVRAEYEAGETPGEAGTRGTAW